MDRKEVTLYDLKVALDAHETRCLEDKTEMKNDIKVLKDDVTVLKSDFKVLQGDVTVLKSDVKVLQSDVKVLQSDVKVLQRDTEHLIKAVDRIESRMWWLLISVIAAPLLALLVEKLLT